MGVPEAKGAGSLREQWASEVRGHRESKWGEQLGGGRPSRSSGCVWSRDGRVRKGVTWLHRQALVCLWAGRSQRLQPASGKEKQMEPGWEEGSWGAGADLGAPPPDFSAQGEAAGGIGGLGVVKGLQQLPRADRGEPLDVSVYLSLKRRCCPMAFMCYLSTLYFLYINFSFSEVY